MKNKTGPNRKKKKLYCRIGIQLNSKLIKFTNWSGERYWHEESYKIRSTGILKKKIDLSFIFVWQTTTLNIKMVARWSISQNESPLASPTWLALGSVTLVLIKTNNSDYSEKGQVRRHSYVTRENPSFDRTTGVHFP